MRKFSRILESKEPKLEILNKVGTTEAELKDIFQELIDEDWEMKINLIYISENGNSSSKPIYSKSYPTISIQFLGPRLGFSPEV